MCGDTFLNKIVIHGFKQDCETHNSCPMLEIKENPDFGLRTG